jgi:hypothetical protein
VSPRVRRDTEKAAANLALRVTRCRIASTCSTVSLATSQSWAIQAMATLLRWSRETNADCPNLQRRRAPGICPLATSGARRCVIPGRPASSWLRRHSRPIIISSSMYYSNGARQLTETRNPNRHPRFSGISSANRPTAIVAQGRNSIAFPHQHFSHSSVRPENVSLTRSSKRSL